MVSLRDTLIEIVSHRSVTGTEAGLAASIEDRLRSLTRSGQRLRRHEDSFVLGPERPGASGRPLIVLAGHLDTVPLGEAWPPRVDGDVLHGRGAVDMKAGIALMLHLAAALAPEEGFAERAFVFYTGEEGPAEGNSLGRVLDAEPWLCRAGLAILLEPTGGALEIGCQGTLHCRVVFTGRACHSARPWTGLHPLEAALPWLARMQRWPERPVEIAGVVFREVVVLTTLHAGDVRNVSPARLEVNLNYRYAPDRTVEEAEAFALGLCPPLRSPAAEDAAITPELAVGVAAEIVDHAGPGRVDQDAPLFRHLLESTGLPRRGKQGWTDVARFSARGVPAVNWGAGDPLLCHRADERIAFSEVEACFARMRAYLGGTGPDLAALSGRSGV